MWDGAKSVTDPRNGRFHTDKEGRFEVVGLVPGWKYTAWLEDPSGQKKNFLTDHLFENVVIKPGEIVDLGDVAVDQRGKRKMK